MGETVNLKRKDNPLDGVLALASAIRQGSKRKRLSADEVLNKTQRIWKAANPLERKAMMIVGNKSSIFDSNRKAVVMEERIILQQLPGPEPPCDAKVNFDLDNVVAQYKESETSTSSHKSKKCIHIAKRKIIVDRSMIGLRAEAVLATPQARSSLFNALKKQRVKLEKK
jgi:hypothetical protein